MRLCSSILSLAAMLLLYNSGHAQEKPVEPVPAQSETKPAANTRLKIGVALEGGGALGIAHLGVLKWFEEHRIPIAFGSNGTGTPQFFRGAATGNQKDRVFQEDRTEVELFGNQYFLGRVGYLHEVFTLPTFVGKQVYIYAAGEIGKMYDDPTAPRLSGDGALGLLAETTFGPVLIGGSVGDTGHHKWFFQLGRVF